MKTVEHCSECGASYSVGEWPYCPHGAVHEAKGFEPYFDDNLQTQINGWGDLNKQFKPKWENDHLVQIAPREKPAQYYRELNERRRERAESDRRERR